MAMMIGKEVQDKYRSQLRSETEIVFLLNELLK